MNKMSDNYYITRLERLRSLLDEHGLDCLLVYNTEEEDPAFLPWILGNLIFDPT